MTNATKTGERLREIVRDPTIGLKSPSPEEHANAMLRAHVLRLISAALQRKREKAMLVKGASLALSVYPTPASRPMSDVDLLVPPERAQTVVQALEAEGFVAHHVRSRSKSRKLLGETQLVASAGAMSQLVEVHDSLDKVVPRPLDISAIEARAMPLSGMQALQIPAPEDHALLVAQHAAAHEWRHVLGFIDLELLLRAGLDVLVLEERAKEARLVTVMFVALSTLRALGSTSVTESLVARFDPGPRRRAFLRTFYDVGRFPVARGEATLGASWIIGQTPLRDDLARYALGVARYGALRLLDRLVGPEAAR